MQKLDVSDDSQAAIEERLDRVEGSAWAEELNRHQSLHAFGARCRSERGARLPQVVSAKERLEKRKYV
jgi:hypothetical protein